MMKKTNVLVGMDVHKGSVMIAVLPEGVREPTLVKRLSHDPRGLRRLLSRLAREHEVRACYEASGGRLRAGADDQGLGPRVRDRVPSSLPLRAPVGRMDETSSGWRQAPLLQTG